MQEERPLFSGGNCCQRYGQLLTGELVEYLYLTIETEVIGENFLEILEHEQWNGRDWLKKPLLISISSLCMLLVFYIKDFNILNILSGSSVYLKETWLATES